MLSDYQIRLVEERDEARDRLRKLETVEERDFYAGLSIAEKADLFAQELAMGAYLRILNRRIRRF